MYSVFSDVRTIGDFFRSLKWAWQRAIKGYCELDTYSIGDWLLNTLPDMCEAINQKRCGYPSAFFDEAMEHYGLKYMDEYNNASEEIRDKVDDYGDKKWGEILSRLTFLLREANEDTCTKVNPYEAEYSRISEEFRDKYGEWGEKLLTDEQKAEVKRTGSQPVYLPHHMPEYKEICERYSEEEHNLNVYREQCKNEALELFSKWFYSLGF